METVLAHSIGLGARRPFQREEESEDAPFDEIRVLGQVGSPQSPAGRG